MQSDFPEAHKIINLIYETAEDTELWPKLLEACRLELEDSRSSSSQEEKALSTHLVRALRMNQRLDKMQNEVGAARNILDCLPMAIITIDQDHRIANLNKLADKLVSESGLLEIRKGALRSNSQSNSGKLLQIISEALRNPHNANRQNTIKLEDPSRQEAMSIYAVKTAGEGKGDEQNYCTLFIASNCLPDYASPEVLKKRYGLTPAESRVAHMLASGDAITDIAKKLDVSQNTVRNQLKSVFAKTDTNRQSELVSLILSTPTHVSDDKSHHPGNSDELKSTTSFQSYTLRDGRQLSFYDLGDPNGLPVLYLHEFVVWDWWNLVGESEITLLGVRLIVPHRPGYLGSQAQREPCLESWSADIAELLDEKEIGQCYVLGYSSGGPFAASFAHYQRQRCLKLGLVNSTAPVANLSELETAKPAMSRLVLGFAKYTPRVYLSFFKALLKSVKADPKNYIRDYLHHWSEYDNHLSEDKFILQSICDCFENCLESNATGLVNESVVLTRPWGFEFSDIAVPTDIWQGDEDRAISIKMAEKLRTIPGATVNVVPGVGHLFIYDYWKVIVSSLVGTAAADSSFSKLTAV